MTTFIALLRGVNVGARTKVPMAELRPLCERLGLANVRTYIQSGNVIFEAAGSASALETALEEALGEAFGFTPAVIVRRAADWKAYLDANPFTEESKVEPNRVLTGLSKRPLNEDAASALQARGAAGEKVAQASGALWFHFPEGSGTSKLSPSLIDRLAGSPVTTRNWRTMQKLQEMATT